MTFKKTFSEGDEFVDFGTDSIGFLSAYEAQSGLLAVFEEEEGGEAAHAVLGAEVVFTLYLPTIARPSYSLASSSITGAIAMQGPHHVAQKSITTGCPVAIVSLTLASVNVNAIMKKNNCMLGGLSGHERASPYFIIYVEVFESLYEVFGKTCSDCRRECERAADVGRVNHH